MSEIKDTKPQIEDRRIRRWVGFVLSTLGFSIFILGAKPNLFELDISVAIGFIQITIFTAGLLLICLGGYLALDSLWPRGTMTIAAELGLRLVGTGYIFAMTTAMADLFGLGTRSFPGVIFFGHWQARGVLMGELVIVIGFLMMIPYKKPTRQPDLAIDE